MLTIAEIGSNYRDFDDVINYVHRLNADVIKLQYYTSFDLYNYGEKVKDVTFTYSMLADFVMTCHDLGKKSMISIFNHLRVDDLNPFIDYHKVASSEITYLPLLEAMRDTGKDVFVSCGGATDDEIETAINIIGKDKIILMGCKVEYPTNRSWPPDGKRIGDKFGCRWGYSDHSKEVYLVKDVCERLGAYAWEKHICFASIHDKPDYEVAITVQEFNMAANNQHKPSLNPYKRKQNKEGKWYRPV
jgi:sialic acid synthase SpsE